MTVLLTGANGFVGSHILERLLAEDRPVRVLLREHSDTRFIAPLLTRVEIIRGSLDSPETLARAAAGATHVIHCAGATRSVTADGLFPVNHQGARHLVQAVNAAGACRRLVLLSSLAVGGPGTRAHPTREDTPPRPLSAYGRSKLAAERVVETECHTESVILRLAAVYGPRDREFLRLFRAARLGLLPVFDGGRQELSLVFAPDAAEVVTRALDAPSPPGLVVNVAAPEALTAGELAREIARAAGRRVRRVSLPRGLLPLICGLAAAAARATGRATLLAHGKYRELIAPGWVADTGRLRQWLGAVCATPPAEGLAATWQWYRQAGWL